MKQKGSEGMARGRKRSDKSKDTATEGISAGVNEAANLLSGALDQAANVAGKAIDMALSSAVAFIPEEDQGQAESEQGYKTRRERNVHKAQEIAKKSNKPTQSPNQKGNKK
ncbi:MAG TPA: hypothetical protein VGB17_11905 [Pyrinomonadaceae bacterium]